MRPLMRLRMPLRAAVGCAGALLLAAAMVPALAGAQSVETPPPTPVPPRGSPSPFPTTLQTPSPPTVPPQIGAAAAVLADLRTGQLLFQQNPEQRRPIASLTKIMTALLVLERTRPSDVVTVSQTAAAPLNSLGLSVLGLQAGEQIEVRHLVFALLLQSSNDAANALAEHVSGTVEGFVADMNARAERLGLADTLFLSPNGLDDRGYSTAHDLVALTRAAYRRPRFREIAATRFHSIPSPTGEDRFIQNRNVLLWLYPGAIGVKTGFTSAAGFCVIATAEREDRRLVAIVLGAPGEPFSEAAELLNYGFEAFERRTLVEDGEPFGPLLLDGHGIPVVAHGRLAGLVPVDTSSEPVREVRAEGVVPFPPAVGEQVATVTVSLGTRVLGEVPLVVARVPAPPPPAAGPWWRRAASAVTDAVGGLLSALLG